MYLTLNSRCRHFQIKLHLQEACKEHKIVHKCFHFKKRTIRFHIGYSTDQSCSFRPSHPWRISIEQFMLFSFTDTLPVFYSVSLNKMRSHFLSPLSTSIYNTLHFLTYVTLTGRFAISAMLVYVSSGM